MGSSRKKPAGPTSSIPSPKSLGPTRKPLFLLKRAAAISESKSSATKLSLRRSAEFLASLAILLGFYEQTEPAVALFAFLQSDHGLVRFKRMRERLDCRQYFAPRHFQLAAVLPGRRKIRVEFRRSFNLA